MNASSSKQHLEIAAKNIMKKFYSIPLQFCFSIFVLSLFLNGCSSSYVLAPHLTSVNIIDRNGFSETISSADRLKQFENVDFQSTLPYQKVLRVYSRDRQGNILSYITSYYPNGQPQQSLDVLNGRAFGPYKEWHSNGQQKIEVLIIGGTADLNPGAEKTWLFDGPSRAWDENGKLIAEIHYEKGSLEGNSLYYHADGTLWKKIPYCRNVIEGNYEIFLPTGELLQSTPYVHDIKHGEAIRWWNKCQIAARECYNEGLLETAEYYNACGEKIAEIIHGNGYRAVFGKEQLVELQEFRHGVLEGEMKIFGRKGQLVRLFHLKNGLKNGEEIEFFDHPLAKPAQPKLSLNWHEDSLQGTIKTWYLNGVLESQRERNRNLKHGLSTAWYQDGSLMLIEEYEKDKLMKGEYYKKGDKTPISRIINGKGTASLYDGDGRFTRTVNYEKGRPLLDE